MTKTNILTPIEVILQQTPSNTLVVFDVDDVLMTAKDQILQPTTHKFAEQLETELESRHSEEEAQMLWSIIWFERKVELVDSRMVTLIQDAQVKGLKVMALTNAWTGSFGNIPSREDWRVKELKDLGYTFKDSWKDIKPKTFKELAPKGFKRFPLFKEGVLFACDLPKGEVLKVFL